MVAQHILDSWFEEFNTVVFGEVLAPVPVRYDPYMDTDKAVGLCWGDRIMLAPGASLEATRRVLLHEMVHVWQAQNGHKMTHGKTFKEWKARCYDLAGLRI
ncbi:MAG TPA: SprT-like domain-containing protein [Candidatus Acidoferrum sp.]|nr:SprT-like domain-containing protein [Candidatus Acidoferrum sp.]